MKWNGKPALEEHHVETGSRGLVVFHQVFFWGIQTAKAETSFFRQTISDVEPHKDPETIGESIL
jgi:hypothetical protein